MFFIRCFLVWFLLAEPVYGQLMDSTAQPDLPVRHPQQDLADVVHAMLPGWKRIVPHDSSTLKTGGKFVAFIPQIGYTLQNSFLVQALVNVAFQQPGANLSTLIASGTYTLNKQSILLFAPTVWSAQNRMVWIGDWRLMQYPQSTFGLGVVNTSLDREINMDYEYLRIYQKVLKHLGPNLYGGLGYALDLHWNIVSQLDNHDLTQISSYQNGVVGRSISSGLLVNLLFDNRANSLNPTKGYYASLQYRPNLEVLGSNSNYQSMLVEARTYIQPSAHSENILAFWSYNALTLSGTPPFLDLPSTGWDTHNNTGRGYIQGRFRGKNLLYFETEYRFGLTRNRLLGGVVFANAQTVTEVASNTFQGVAPAAGAGLRLNLNKISRANLAIDYGVGIGGSHGLFFNFSEVF